MDDRFKLFDSSANRSEKISNLQILKRQLLQEERENHIDEWSETLLRPLLDQLTSEPCQLVAEQLLDVVSILLSKCSESVCEKSEVFVSHAINTVVVPSSSEQMKGCCMHLLKATSYRGIPLEIFKHLLLVQANQLIVDCLSLVPQVQGNPKRIANCVVPFLRHKNFRIRIAAIKSIDNLIRRSPWKDTFNIVSLLHALESHEISVSDFFSDNTRTNYMAMLTFDPQLSVKREWFKTLIEWTVTLEDRADVDRWFCPYILTGFLDSSVGEEISTLAKSRIERIEEWIGKHLRHFFKAFLKNTGEVDRSAKMVKLVVSVVNQETLVAFLPDLIQWLENQQQVDVGICFAISSKCPDNIWFNALRFGTSSNWDLLDAIVPEKGELSEGTSEEILKILCDGCVAFSHAAMLRIWEKVRKDNCGKSLFSGIILSPFQVSERPVNADLLKRTAEKIIDLQSVEFSHNLVRALNKWGNPDAEILSLILDSCRRARIIEQHFLIDLSTLIDIDLLLAHLLEEATEAENAVLLEVIRCFCKMAKKLDECLISALSRKISLHRIECLNQIPSQLCDAEIDRILKSILQLQRNASDELRSACLDFFALHAKNDRVLKILDLVVPWALDGGGEMAEKTKLLIESSANREVMIEYCNECESRGFIARLYFVRNVILL